MKRRAMLFTTLLLLACTVAPLLAHTPFRFTGTIKKWDRPTLTLDTKENGTVAIKVESSFAEILYKGKTATVDELKVGRSVIVDGTGDTITDVEAIKVSVDPPKK
jgi:hypothetical protein